MGSVRRALLEDAAAIAAVHLAAWKTTYPGILPESFLAAQSLDERIVTWRERLANPGPKSSVFVACSRDGDVIGFAWGGPSRRPEAGCEGELFSIYLLKEAQGQGIGALLLKSVAKSLIENELRSMAVWVFAVNPARHFYEALGARPVTEKKFDWGGELLTEIAYVWPDLTAL
jgi:GNAT superfamily N-acetyltransferase